MSMRVAQIEPKLVQNLLDQDIILLDVRTPEEYNHVRIESSMHIPIEELHFRFKELPKDKRIIVVCHHGTRSIQACGFLKAHEYQFVDNLKGGIDAWAQEVDQTIDRYKF